VSWLCSRIFFVFSVIFVLAQVTAAFQKSLADVLPESGEVAGWNKHRVTQHYEGEDLYEYIDGGAEIYHEYGFIQVVVQDYISDAEKSVSVEIFEMASPASAYGIYTFKTHSKGQMVRLGADAQLADYYLNFWKGPILVTITGFDETEDTRAGLLNIAKSVNSKMPDGEDKPIIVSFLPEENLVVQSLKYFTGFLGLRNSHPFFDLDIVGYEEGIKGDYSGEYGLFIFRFKDETECQNGLGKMHGQNDRRGRQFFVDSLREYLLLVMGDVDRQRAEEIFAQTRKKIHFSNLTHPLGWE
jgi:hypothetical protein